MASTTTTTAVFGNFSVDSGDCYLSLDIAITLVVINAAVAVCGLVLNLSVFLAIVLNSKLRKEITNAFLGSLAIADLIINTFGQSGFSAQVIYTHKRQCTGTWAYHAFTIGCSNSMFLSMVCLTMVTIERFLGVKAPVFHRRYLTPKLVSTVILLVVVATIGFASFSFLERNRNDGSFNRAWIFGVFCFTAIVMNMCTMFFTRRFLQRRSRSSARSAAEREVLKAKMRRVTLLLLVLVMALTAWFLVIVIVILYLANELTLAVVYGILIVIFLNSCLNPVVYCLMAPDIREATLRLLRQANPFDLFKKATEQQNE